MSAGESWQVLVRAVLARWHGGPDGDLEDRDEGLAPLVDRLAETPEELRTRCLQLLERHLDRPPAGWIHPTWLLACLPEEPLLRFWVLSLLPAGVRQAIVAEMEKGTGGGEVATVPCQAPAWLGDWWQHELQGRLACPRPLPRAGGDPSPLGWLFQLAPADLELLLQVHGLRPFAAVLETWRRERSKEEVLRVAFGLPEILRKRLVERARDRAFDETSVAAWAAWAAWEERAAELLAAAASPGELPLLLAFADLAASATARRRTEDAVRIACRLPRPRGEVLFARLAEDLADLAPGDPGRWDRWLAEDADDLAACGLIRRPDPEEALS
jgi:hypothetical protein